MSWLVPRGSLTPAQTQAVEFDLGAHRLILGPPGSGKTLVALHRARELADRFRISPLHYRIFVYTKALKAYIRSAVDDLGLPDGCVLTFDQWCLDFYRAKIGGGLPFTDSSPDFPAIRQEIRGYLRTGFGGGFHRNARKPLKFAMVDEGQDLDAAAYGILTASAEHLTVFMDNKQQLYERGADPRDVLGALGLGGSALTLPAAYRCTPYIVRLAAAFIPDAAGRDQFIEQNAQEGERQQPLVHIANDREELTGHLIETLRSRVDRGERVGVLFPSRKILHETGGKLLEAGLAVEFPRSVGGDKPANRPAHDFTTNRPKLLAYPSAKGLTFDSVLLPFFNRQRFRQDLSDELLERWIFVAMTRATKWIYLSGLSPLLHEDRLLALEAGKQLTIQRGGETGATEPAKKPDTEPPDLSDLF